jgi:ATP/maltotriose-dependent transcriptional regulator MalT
MRVMEQIVSVFTERRVMTHLSLRGLEAQPVRASRLMNSEIAPELCVSVHDVKYHLSSTCWKLDIDISDWTERSVIHLGIPSARRSEGS